MKTFFIILLFLFIGNSISYELDAILQVLNDSQNTRLDFKSSKLGSIWTNEMTKALRNIRPKTLNLENNRIEGRAARMIAEALNDTRITHLNLQGNNMGYYVVWEFAKILKHTRITHLDLSNNNLGEGINAISNILRETEITHLNLEGNEFGEENITNFVNNLKGSKIESLNLGSNDLRQSEIIQILTALKETNITSLDLHSNGGGVASGFEGFSNFLEATKLNYLSLGVYQHMSTREISAIAKVLKKTKITELNLEWLSMGPDATRDLATALNHSEITRIHFGVKISQEISAIADILRNTKIIDMSFASSGIGDGGVEAIARELPRTKITHLNLRGNDVTKNGAIAIANVLKDTKIVSLDFGMNALGNEGVKAIAGALGGSQIKSLNLQETSLGYDGVIALAVILKDTKITHLNLANNKITCSGTIFLAANLKNTGITYLDLGSNDIGNSGAVALANALNDTEIISLDLVENEKIGDQGRSALFNSSKNDDLLLVRLDNYASVLLDRNELGLMNVYSRFRNLVRIANGTLEFIVDDENTRKFVDIVKKKKQAFIDYFLSQWDNEYTEVQVRDFVVNIEKRPFIEPPSSIAPGLTSCNFLCLVSLFIIYVYRN